MCTPCRSSNAFISAGGQAEPPTTTSRSDETSIGWPSSAFLSSSASSPVQMVGTAPATVGFSVAMSAASGSGVRKRSGMIIDAPTISAA